jgi:anti-sigma factor RsiW
MSPPHIPEDYFTILAGELPPARQDAIEAHLRECSRCAEELAAVQRALQVLPTLPVAAVEATLADRVRALAIRTPHPRTLWWRSPQLAACAACLLLGIGIGLGLSRRATNLAVLPPRPVPVAPAAPVSVPTPPPTAQTPTQHPPVPVSPRTDAQTAQSAPHTPHRQPPPVTMAQGPRSDTLITRGAAAATDITLTEPQALDSLTTTLHDRLTTLPTVGTRLATERVGVLPLLAYDPLTAAQARSLTTSLVAALGRAQLLLAPADQVAKAVLALALPDDTVPGTAEVQRLQQATGCALWLTGTVGMTDGELVLSVRVLEGATGAELLRERLQTPVEWHK